MANGNQSVQEAASLILRALANVTTQDIQPMGLPQELRLVAAPQQPTVTSSHADYSTGTPMVYESKSVKCFGLLTT